MKLNIYAVYDKVAQAYKQPLIFQNRDEIVVRMMKNTLLDDRESSEFKNNPLDFAIYRLGKFDDNTGEITSDIAKIVDISTLLDPEETKLEAVQ